MGKIYGDIEVKRGKQHHYLWMDLNFEDDGKVTVSMTPYIEEIIKNYPEEIGSSTAMTPAMKHLFETIEKSDAKFIPEEQAMQFHHNVTKLLFVSTKAGWDIQTAVAFLTMREKSPDKDDWGKLKRITKYLNGTRNL